MHKYFQKYNFIIGLSILFLFISSYASNFEDKVKKLEQAHNCHDVKKGLTFYAEAAKFVMVGRWEVEGKDKLRERFEWDAAVNGTLKFMDIKTSGDTVTCKVEERNHMFKLLGIETIHYEYVTFLFKKGLIKEVRAKLTPKATKIIEESFFSFVNWASSKRSQALAELKADGKFLFIKEKAEKWLTLLREYRNKVKNEPNKR